MDAVAIENNALTGYPWPAQVIHPAECHRVSYCCGDLSKQADYIDTDSAFPKTISGYANTVLCVHDIAIKS